LLGCTNSGTSLERPDKPASATDTLEWRPSLDAEPLYVAFEAATGYSAFDLADINTALKGDLVEACMRDAGFRYATPPPSGVELQMVGVEIGGVAAVGLDLLDSGQISGTTQVTVPPAQQQTLQQCQLNADNAVTGTETDALATIDGLMQVGTAEAAASTASDDRCLSAKPEYQRCEQSVGFRVEDAINEAGDDDAALQILIEVSGGESAVGPARDLLTVIAARRADAAPRLSIERLAKAVIVL
jgi:hypothetical protein